MPHFLGRFPEERIIKGPKSKDSSRTIMNAMISMIRRRVLLGTVGIKC